jgi:hypothetical protein
MKSYISRKLPLETRTTDHIFDSRLVGGVMVSDCTVTIPDVKEGFKER